MARRDSTPRLRPAAPTAGNLRPCPPAHSTAFLSNPLCAITLDVSKTPPPLRYFPRLSRVLPRTSDVANVKNLSHSTTASLSSNSRGEWRVIASLTAAR